MPYSITGDAGLKLDDRSFLLPDTLIQDHQLNHAVRHYQYGALNGSTRQSYESGLKALSLFGAMYNLPSFTGNSNFPVLNEDILIYFVSHCADRLGLKHSTIKMYLSGIRNKYIEIGYGNPLQCNNVPYLRLQLTLRGIKRLHVPVHHVKLPITVQVLQDLAQVFNRGIFGSYVDLLMKSACILAFFAFLRCGELCTKSNTYDYSIHLSQDSISFIYDNDNRIQEMVLFLKASKTDPFRHGSDITLFHTGGIICPIHILSAYMVARTAMGGSPQDPLFLLPTGKALSRSCFIDMLKVALQRAGRNPDNYSGHSFRRGAATTAAENQIPAYLIKAMGRWTSDCYNLYIQTPKNTIKHAMTTLATL
jgi:hypothetical protein